LVNDFKYSFYIKDPDNAFGNGFVETFTRKIENDITNKQSSLEDVE
jgi:hypothetical protein